MAAAEQLPVAKARAGCPAAWDALFRRFQLPLYVYVYELRRDEQASLDIVQETFISAVQHLGSLRDDEKFGSWLFAIAHQKCTQHWRQQTKAPAGETTEALEEFDPSPDELLIKREEESEFMELVKELPLPQRTALLLHYLEEFSLQEIANITNTKLGTVKSRLHNAKKSLRNALAKRK